MAIEFKHRGRLWRADTVDEAVALRRKLEAMDAAAFEAGEDLPYVNRDDVWTHDSVTDLLKNCGKLQKQFLRIICVTGQAYTSETLVSQLYLESEVALAGVLSGLSKQLKKMGLKPADLYSVEVSWSGKEKTRYLRVTNDFRWCAAELGWPDKWPE